MKMPGHRNISRTGERHQCVGLEPVGVNHVGSLASQAPRERRRPSRGSGESHGGSERIDAGTVSQLRHRVGERKDRRLRPEGDRLLEQRTGGKAQHRRLEPGSELLERGDEVEKRTLRTPELANRIDEQDLHSAAARCR